MASVAIMVGGAVLNAATFIGGNYLAKYLSGDSGQAALDEKKRHDLALEKYQRDYAQYQKGSHTTPGLGLHNKIGKRTKPSTTFQDTDAALALYNQTRQAKVAMPVEPQFSDYYKTQPAAEEWRNCSSSAPAPWPLDMPPFASCELVLHASIYTTWTLNLPRSTTAPRGTGKGMAAIKKTG